jgi:hypothetical protein
MSVPPTGSRDEGARLLQAGDFDAALRLLQQAVAENPGDGRAHGYLGICHARRGDLPTALLSLQEAARLQPQDPGASYNLAMGLCQAQRLPEARAAVERTLALNPEHANAQQLLARIRAAQPSTPSPSAPSPPPVGDASGVPAAGASPYGAAPGPTAGIPSYTPAAASPQTWSPVPPQAPEAQPGAWTTAPGAAAVNAPQGMQYVPQAAPQPVMEPPGVGRRLARGWVWGILYGQWWTLWTVISGALWGGLHFTVPEILTLVVMALAFAFFGSLCGLIIGAINASEGTGTVVGVGTGLLMCLLEALVTKSAFGFINVFWYFVTGRFVGRSITRKVQQPVSQ